MNLCWKFNHNSCQGKQNFFFIPFSAENLSKYDDILDARQVYSLTAIAAATSRSFGVCSRAFNKLETLDSIPEDEKKAYQELAIEIFSRLVFNQPVFHFLPYRNFLCLILFEKGNAIRPEKPGEKSGHFRTMQPITTLPVTADGHLLVASCDPLVGQLCYCIFTPCYSRGSHPDFKGGQLAICGRLFLHTNPMLFTTSNICLKLAKCD